MSVHLFAIIGAFAGFHVMASFQGLVAGLVIAMFLHFLHREYFSPRIEQGALQTEFYELLVCLHAKCAKADGVVAPCEIKAFRSAVMVSEKEYPWVSRIFDRARKSIIGYEAQAKRLAEISAPNPEDLTTILEGLYYTAASNGKIVEQQLAFLKVCGNLFGFSEQDQKILRYKFGIAEDGTLHHPFEGGESAGKTNADAKATLEINGKNVFRILKVSEKASLEEVRTSYKKLIKKNHPDVLRAKGASDVQIKRAEHTVSELTEAYEMVKIALS